MRYLGMSVVAGAALVLAACGGEKTPAADTTKPADTVAAAPAMAAPAMAGAMSPITGKTVEIKMVGDDKGYRFEPAEVTIKTGDGVKFIMASGGPHNVAFDPATFPAAAKAQMVANMTEPMNELAGKLLTAPNETYTLSFGGIPAGTYEFHCTPHMPMNMKGKITVTP